MSRSEIPDQWLIDAARNRVHEFCEQLRNIPPSVHAATPVPNLDWTVADLAQHIACLPSYWNARNAEGDRFERPTDFAAFSDQARAHITSTDLDALAGRIEAEYETYLGELGGPDAGAARWLYGRPVTATNMCGFILNELVLHGCDLAAVTGASRPRFTSREANVAIDASMVTIPVFIDEDKAKAQPDGVYHIAFKEGRDYTWTKQGSTLSIAEGRPESADAKMRADPATFLMASLGRISQVRAGLSGKMLAYGRRPWRLMGLGTIAIDGV